MDQELTEYAIHELIIEIIDEQSPHEVPDIVTCPPGVSDETEIPEGRYVMDWDAGIWRKVS